MKSKPKNRTLIGIVCMVLAVAITFLIAPVVNKLTTDTTDVVRLREDIKQGSQITESQIESVKMKTDTLPAGTLVNASDVVGKYAAANLFAGDTLTKAKVSGESNTASDVLAGLDGTKVAVSVTIDSFAAGLSGKLQNGDIVSLIVVDKDAKATIPSEFKYVKVITTTTAGGIDQDSIVKNEDGSYEIPSTITVLVNTTQAKLLAKYDNDCTVQVALVYRGTVENANKFLAKQDEYFATKGDNDQKTDSTPADETSGGNDIIKQANDIINGNADYYDVNEAVKNNG